MLERRSHIVWQPCAILAGLLLTGCADPPTIPEPAAYSVEPLHQWAGGEVRVTASDGAFEAGDVILTGADTLAVFEQQTDHVVLPLPTTADGPITLGVWRSRALLGEVALEAYGFEEVKEYPARMGDMISEVPMPWGVSVAARTFERCQDEWGGGWGGDFVWLHPSTGMHRTFRGTVCRLTLFRVGVDPLEPELYYEYRRGTDEECDDDYCLVVHGGRIVAGDLVDMGWFKRPCNRWSCEPLAGDIWIVPDWAHTCRVVSTPTGETCERISSGFGDDPQDIVRLWSSDVALSLGPVIAYRMSTGEEIYRIGHKWSFSGAPDEARGVFYLVTRRGSEIVTVRGSDGVIERTHLASGVGSVAYDPERDLLYVLVDRTLEARDPVSFRLVGRVALPEDLRGGYRRILVDDDTQRAFVVLSAARRYDVALDEWRGTAGTPVISVRLPPR